MTTDDLLAMIKKQPVGFACAMLCLICGGLLYFRSDKIAENQAEYEAKSAQAARILDNVRNSEKLPAQVAEIEVLSKEMESRLVHASQLAVNLQYFYKLEAETEVKLIDVRQNALPKAAGKTLYAGIPFNVAVQGTFKQVMSFLQKLENGPHFCHFTSVNFNKTGGPDPAGMTITINLELLGVP